MRPSPALAAALAAAALLLLFPSATAIPDVRHISVAFRETGCAETEWCLALDPESPTLTWGEQVEFVIVNPATNFHPHNLQVSSFGSKVEPLRPGDESALVLVAKQSGEFYLYSAVKTGDESDRARGMEATFTVVDPQAEKTRLKLPAPGAAALVPLLAAAGLATRSFKNDRGVPTRRP